MVGFIIPDHKAGYFLGVNVGIGRVPLDSHDEKHRCESPQRGFGAFLPDEKDGSNGPG